MEHHIQVNAVVSVEFIPDPLTYACSSAAVAPGPMLRCSVCWMDKPEVQMKVASATCKHQANICAYCIHSYVTSEVWKGKVSWWIYCGSAGASRLGMSKACKAMQGACSCCLPPTG